jgi:hypothetical protein
MKCPDCGTETRHSGTFETMVGYGEDANGHAHDDNCQKRRYVCACGRSWVESIQRRCEEAEPCDWRGKSVCFCHHSGKVEAWSDPEDYLT